MGGGGEGQLTGAAVGCGGVEASCWRGTAGGGDTHHSAEEALRDGGRGGERGGVYSNKGGKVTRNYNENLR